jgi:hypothetical protein
MPILPPPGAVLLAAAFAAGGHGKPDLHAYVSVTQLPKAVQLASPVHGLRGWWLALLGGGGGVFRVTARVPHQACASATLTIPAQPGGRYEVRIYCKR